MPKFNENFKKNKGFDKEIPETIEAERWLDPDTFVYRGDVWKLEYNGKVEKVCSLNADYRGEA